MITVRALAPCKITWGLSKWSYPIRYPGPPVITARCSESCLDVMVQVEGAPVMMKSYLYSPHHRVEQCDYRITAIKLPVPQRRASWFLKSVEGHLPGVWRSTLWKKSVSIVSLELLRSLFQRCVLWGAVLPVARSVLWESISLPTAISRYLPRLHVLPVIPGKQEPVSREREEVRIFGNSVVRVLASYSMLKHLVEGMWLAIAGQGCV